MFSEDDKPSLEYLRRAMATFYLLPPRQVVGEHVTNFLRSMFPGMTWSNRILPDLAETLSQTAHQQAGVYVVYQEDIADDGDPAAALLRDFGAEQGDEVIEIRGDIRGGLAEAGRWRVPVL